MPRRATRGFALISVLWAAAILSLIAATLGVASLISLRIAHAGLDRGRYEALADAGLNRAVLALLDRRRENRWRVDGVPRTFAFDGTQMSVQIEDEAGKIDINAVDRSNLVALFAAAGLTGEKVDALSDEILDWRDNSPFKRLHGGKLADYQGAGFRYGPRQAPFQTLDEVRLVLDMTPDLYARILPAITIYSRQTGVDPATAPALVRKAYGLSAPGSPSGAIGPVTNGIIDPAIPIAGWTFTVRVRIAARNDTIFHQDSVIRLTGDTDHPFWVFARHEQIVRTDG